MPTSLSPRKAHISNYADQAAARDQGVEDATPYIVEFREKRLVIGDVAELTSRVVVALECPVRGRGDYQVDRLWWKYERAGVSAVQDMRCWQGSSRILYRRGYFTVFGCSRDVTLWVGNGAKPSRQNGAKVGRQVGHVTQLQPLVAPQLMHL
jgi:hypothetical protein